MSSLLLLLTAVAMGCAAPPSHATDTAAPSAQATAAPSAQATAPTDAGGRGNVDAILDAAHHAGAGLTTLAANFSMERRDALTEDVERRRGRLVVSGAAGPARRLAVRLDQFIDGTGRASDERRWFLYHDGWLIERDDARRLLIERQMVPAGESIDPLQPGDGPIALPLGASRDEVLKAYDVSNATLPESPMWKELPPHDVLRLVPRAGTKAATDVRSVIVGWDRATALPVAIVVESREGDRSLTRLRAVATAALAPEDAALVATPGPVPEGWTHDRRPLAP